MNFLAIDTATEACSVALYADGSISEQYDVAPRLHGERVLPMATALLDEAGLSIHALDAIAFGRGPGAFTGVRIAAGVVQGIAYAANLPIVPVSDLAAVAYGAWRQHNQDRVLVCLDARMAEVYWGLFTVASDGDVIETSAERLSTPEHVQCEESFFAAGHGWQAYPQLEKRFIEQLTGIDKLLLPRAADIAMIAAPKIKAGDVLEAREALPVYLREQVAWKQS